MGAIDECYRKGVKTIRILGGYIKLEEMIEPFIQDADLIINAAEQPKHLRGKNYLITKNAAKMYYKKDQLLLI